MTTIEYYNNNADSFCEGTADVNMSSLYGHFEKHLPASGHILDCGCGYGRDGKYFMSKGYEVTFNRNARWQSPTNYRWRYSKYKFENFGEIINICPVNAIKLEETGISSKEGKDGLIELKKYITEKIKEYKIEKPNSSSYRCDIRKSAIAYNNPSGQNRHDCNSSSKAEDAGLREFDRAMYSQRKALVHIFHTSKQMC